MLIHFGVTPYMVFDGDYLPSKASTEKERAKKRDESKKLGLELHRLGKPSQAHLELQKAVDVTPEMARQLIEELKKLGVQYIVAPYEADAQLAYLERKGLIQGIISEDSDLLVFGAKCLLTKLDQYGDCVEINRNDFTACREISLVGWTDSEFRRMAILSGCDYLTNINKMGLKTAYRHVRKYKTIEKILQMLKCDGQYTIPIGYLEAFKKAELTFLHQRVFCPLVNDVVMNTEMATKNEPEELAFIGNAVDRDVALGVATGDLHPMTKEPITVVSKSRSLPRTPWGKSLKESLSTPSDLKANKSIKTFFKSERTPLAELDPNSFKPSPSQQRLLQQTSRSWRSSPALAPPTLPRSSASMPSPAMPSHPHGPASTFSAPHAQKRRRLCIESEEKAELPEAFIKGDSQKSRFFTPPVPDPSPSLKRNGKIREKDQKINIWSDDSIEDVMAELPDVSDRPVLGNRGRLEIFEDKSAESTMNHLPTLHRNISSTYRDPQSATTSMSSKNTTLVTTSVSTSPLLSTTDSPDRAKSKTVALAEKFSYQPATEQYPHQRSGDSHNSKGTDCQEPNQPRVTTSTSGRSALDSFSSTPTTSGDPGVAELTALEMEAADKPRPPLQRKAVEHKVKPGEYQSLLHNKTKPPLRRHGSMTLLQMLGAGALTRTQSCIARLGSSGSVTEEPSRLGTESTADDILPPNVTALNIPNNLGLQLASTKGSEDAMIPDSEEEASDLEEPEAPALNLGRLAFSG